MWDVLALFCILTDQLSYPKRKTSSTSFMFESYFSHYRVEDIKKRYVTYVVKTP